MSSDQKMSGKTWRGREIGVAVNHPAAQGLSGLDMMQKVITGELPAPSISRTMNFWLAEIERGAAVFEGEPTEDVLNPMGGVHGGWALAIIDSACGCAGMSALDAGYGFTTIETKTNFVRAIKPNSGVYRCEAKVLAQGRTILTTDSKVTGPDGKLYAHGTSTLMVLKA